MTRSAFVARADSHRCVVTSSNTTRVSRSGLESLFDCRQSERAPCPYTRFHLNLLQHYAQHLLLRRGWRAPFRTKVWVTIIHRCAPYAQIAHVVLVEGSGNGFPVQQAATVRLVLDAVAPRAQLTVLRIGRGQERASA